MWLRRLLVVPSRPRVCSLQFCILREVVLDRKAQEKQQQQIKMGNLPGPPKMQFLQVGPARLQTSPHHIASGAVSLPPSARTVT